MSSAIAVMALITLSGATDLSGRVQNEQGVPLGEARVFLEQGLAGVVREAAVAQDGSFQFDGLEPGQVGLFAVSAGYGFGGMSLTLGVEDRLPPVSLVLARENSWTGKVKDAEGKAVAGARFTRLLLMEPYKVGIPLAKLVALGFEEPVSREDGKYTIGQIPGNTNIGVKVAHPLYAQEALVLSSGVRDVVLHRGVIVQGEVLTRGENRAVSDAYVIVKNAQPPHDTTITRTDGMGQFTIRLKPGVYVYHAEARGLRSPGGEQLRVLDDQPQPRARLFVAGTGEIAGTVLDAVTGDPVGDVRLTLHTDEHLAAITRTGPTGRYRFDVTEGESVVRLANAPGYLPPETRAYRVSVGEGQRIELAGLFLAPIPAFRLHVLGTDGETPAGGALVTLLRPQHFGWQVADAEGWVSLKMKSFPDDGRIMGKVEHPELAAGALFSLSLGDATEARVQLLPFGQVSGKVAAARGRGLAGVPVEGFYPGSGEQEALSLWRVLSGPDGRFVWPFVLPGVPQRCIARSATDLRAESPLFNLAPQDTKADVDLILDKSAAGSSLMGDALRWPDGRGGKVSVAAIPALAGKPAVVFFCEVAEAAAVAEGAAGAKQSLGATPLVFAVVVSGRGVPPSVPGVTVLHGAAPGTATTYVVDAAGKVVLETYDMPPAHFLGAVQ